MASMRRIRSYQSNSDCGHTFRWGMLGAAILSLVATSDASAQFAYGYMRVDPGPAYEDDLPPIPPRAVVYRLQDRGFTEIGRPRFDGRAYVVDATNPAGHRIRLFVDAREGGVIGRQRLDAPYYPSGRVARAAPGYGWTEDDAASGRTGRDPEALLPPRDVPLPRPSLHAEIDRAPTAAPRSGSAETNPFGINPDGRSASKNDRARAAAAPRKTAKLTQPVKPPAPRVAPEAPTPQEVPHPDAAKAPEPIKAPATAKAAVESPKAEPAPLTPAANQLAPVEKPAEASPTPQAADRPATEKPAEEKVANKAPAAKDGANQGWQDPPASDAKRNVRVIGGAIVVPGGGTEATPATAN